MKSGELQTDVINDEVKQGLGIQAPVLYERDWPEMKTSQNIIKAIAILLPSAGAVVIAVAFFICTSREGQTLEDKVLEACVSIIGLAVATWVGLNIASAIDRKELRDLEDAIADNKKSTNEIKQEITRLHARQRDMIESMLLDMEMAFNQFGQEIMCSYWADQFSLSGQGSIAKLLWSMDYETVRKIHAVVDQLIRIIHKYDTQKLTSSIMDRKHALIESLICDAMKLTPDDAKHQALQSFLKYALGELNYYHGMSLDKSEESRETYLKQAGDIYIRFMETFVCKSSDCDAIYRYLNNTIAQCYSEIIYGRGGINENDAQDRNFAALADKYTDACIHEYGDCKEEMFLKNAGVWIERKAKNIDERKKALDLYERAIEVGNNSFHTTYRVEISLLNRLVQDALGGENIFKVPFIKAFCSHVKGQNVKAEALPILEKLEHYLELYPAIHDGPSSFYYDMKAFTILYHGLLEETVFHDIQAKMKPYVEMSTIVNGESSTSLSKAVRDIAFM